MTPDELIKIFKEMPFKEKVYVLECICKDRKIVDFAMMGPNERKVWYRGKEL